MIKMIVIDLDETLLHSDKTISPFSEQVLKKAGSQGIKVVFATARPIRTVRYYFDQVKCDAVICHNGAVTLIGGKRANRCFTVPIQDARQLLALLHTRNPHKKLSVEIDDRLYANFDVTLFWGNNDREREMLKASSQLTDFSDLPDIDADKLLIELNSEKEYVEILSLLPANLYGELSDHGKLCLVMNKHATKFNAIDYLAKQWDIALADIAAFGDDYNDIEMIKRCGTGIAMGNAIDEVKQAADGITDTNNNDGVAKYISSTILPDSKVR